MNVPTAKVFVAEQDLALFAALIGRKPMSKTLRESISHGESDTAPLAPTAVTSEVPPQATTHVTTHEAWHEAWIQRRVQLSGWVRDVSTAAKKRLVEARSRLHM
jgi:hypothetical protein